jgi:glutathione S-transferase
MNTSLTSHVTSPVTSPITSPAAAAAFQPSTSPIAKPAKPIRVHDFELSGHAHRVRLMLSLLQLPYETVAVDLAGGEHRQAAFLARNPFGQVPVIEDGELTLADSNAILVYLATRYDPARRWLPDGAVEQARVQAWLSVAAGPLAAGPAAARIACLFGGTVQPGSVDIAERLFAVMDSHLGQASWLAGDHATVADVALYSYTAHAPEGGLSLDRWPHIQAWIARVGALPGFLGLRKSPWPARS